MTAKKSSKVQAPIAINTQIVTAYQNITVQTNDLNGAGLDFIMLVGELMAAQIISGREYRAAIEQVGINPLVAVKPSHAEIIPTACEILMNGRDGVTVAKLLSVATRAKRSGSEIGESNLADLDENLPTIKEISDAKKSESESESVEVAVPSLDALVIGFVAELKKLTKGDKINTATFTDISTPALAELKVIMGALSQNRKLAKK
jgi:hypothetical protein